MPSGALLSVIVLKRMVVNAFNVVKPPPRLVAVFPEIGRVDDRRVFVAEKIRTAIDAAANGRGVAGNRSRSHYEFFKIR